MPTPRPPQRASTPRASSNKPSRPRRLCSRCGSGFNPRAEQTECDDCQRKQARAERRAARLDTTERAAWTLRFDLKDWQRAALASWQAADSRGVVEAATGTGKTTVALAAIESLRAENAELRVAIIVPTKVLADQWRAQLQTNLSIPRTHIGEQHSDAAISWRYEHPVLIAVVNTARTSLIGVLDRWRTAGHPALLVVDECHRAGSEFNAKIFAGHYDFSLGLSATPERDDFGHHRVYEGLGQPVYRYPLLNALDDGVLAPVTSINLYVDFTNAELGEWERLTADIGDTLRNLVSRYPELQGVSSEALFKEIQKLAKAEDGLALLLMKLLSDRRTLLAEADARIKCQHEIVAWLKANGRRALVFHETIEAAKRSHAMFGAADVTAVLDHSQLDKSTRRKAMDDFRTEKCQVLVAVRALDEGIDVPDASVAIIAAGSRSRRQRIQRFGRVLRPAANKHALVISILVRGTIEETVVGGRDVALLGPARVRHHRWPGRNVNDAVTASASTYRGVDGAVHSVEDALTLVSVGLWEPGMDAQSFHLATSPGGFSTRQADFSANAWYVVDDIRNDIGVPLHAFDRLRERVRRMYRQSLDPDKAADPELIHGSEIDAVRREWRRAEQAEARSGRVRTKRQS